MIEYSFALEKILQTANKLKTQTTQLSNVLQKVCAQTIQAPFPIPPFTNSAMDGFAIRSQETKMASKQKPVIFTVIGTMTAGETKKIFSIHHENISIEINTGAPIPDPFDAVVKLEDVEIISDDETGKKTIKIFNPIKQKQNIRFSGEDFNLGEHLILEGTPIDPEHCMSLACLGYTQIKTYIAPTFSIFGTGKELVVQTNEKKTLGFGKIFDSNTPYLKAYIQNLNLKLNVIETNPDDPKLFQEKLECLSQKNHDPHIIISTGAVSKGSMDFIPSLLEKLGAKILFHRVKIKPGKPILFAILPNQSYFFGLPGNPTAVAVGLRFFVIPLLRKLQGLTEESCLQARLINHLPANPNLTCFYKAHASIKKEHLFVECLAGQQSFKIKPLLKANAWIKLNPSTTETELGTSVDIFPLHHEAFLCKTPSPYKSTSTAHFENTVNMNP